MFLVTNLGKSLLSGVQQIDKPITKIVKATNRIVTPIKPYYYEAKLTKVNTAVEKAFINDSSPIPTPIYEKFKTSTQDNIKSNTLLFYNPHTQIKFNASNLSTKAHNKVSYLYNQNKGQHQINKFTAQNIEFDTFNPQSKTNTLLAYFLNDKYNYKTREILGDEKLNLNHKQLLTKLDPIKTNTLHIQDISLLDENLALKLAKNKQRILVHNGNEFFVLIPRLEKNTLTKTHEVFWSFVDENNNYYAEFNTLQDTHKSKFKQLNHIQQQKQQNLQFEYEKNNIALNLKDAQNNLTDLEQSLNDLKIQWESNNKNIIFSKDYHELTKNIGQTKLEITNLKQELATIQTQTPKSNITNTNDAIAPDSKFNLQQVLFMLKQDKQELSLVINNPKLSKPKSNSFSSVINATNFLQHKLTRYQQSNQNNKYISKFKYNNLIEAVSAMYGKTHEQFIKEYPQVSRKLLKPFKPKFDLKQVLSATGEHAFSYDLNLVFANKQELNHIKRKNGKTIIDNVIQPLINNKKDFLLHVKPKSTNFNSKHIEDYISIQYIESENKWYIVSVSGMFASKEIQVDNIQNQLETLTKNYNVQLYTKPQHEFSRAQWRFKGKVPLGTSANALHAKLSAHKKTWKGDKNPDEEYDRAEKSLLNVWRGHEIRAKTIEYKQRKKPYKNVVSRFFNSYLNPISFEHRQGWKSGASERKAKFNGEDRFRRVKGDMIEGAFQSIDNSLAYIITMAASDTNVYGPINHDNTVMWGTHMATCTPLQLLADAIGVTAANSKAKNGHLFSLSMKNTVNDLARQAKHATTKNDLDLKLFEDIAILHTAQNNDFDDSSSYFTSKEGKSFISTDKASSIATIKESDIFIKEIKEQTRTFNIDGQELDLEQARLIMAQKLLENMAVCHDLIMQHKAQNKMTLGIAGFGQFLQNLVRMGIIFANVFLPGVSIPAAKLTRLIRMAVQPLGGGVDGLMQKEYLMRTEVNKPGHKMTRQAIEYNLDQVIDTLSAEEFETHVIRIMTSYGHTHYTAGQIKALPKKDRDLLLASFVFDGEKIHTSVSYNAERRAGEVIKYFNEEFAKYDELSQAYNFEISSVDNGNENAGIKINQLKNKLKRLDQKEQLLSEQRILFEQGLEYIEAKNSSPPQYVTPEYQYAWGTLQRNYPKSKVVKLLQVDSPQATVGYTFKQLMKNPAEVLQHTLFRAAFVFWGLDEVGFAIANLTEQNGGDQVAQDIAVSAWYSQVFASATIGGVASYLEHVSTYGRPAWHEAYVSAFILKLREAASKNNHEINKLKQELYNLTPSNKNYLIIQNKIASLTKLGLVIQKQQQLLEYNIKPQKAITDLTKTEKLFIFADDTAQNINMENLQKSSAEILSSCVASLIPKSANKLANSLSTDRTWIQKAQIKTNLWVEGESILSSPLEKLKSAFKSTNIKQQELEQNINKANQQLNNYTHDIDTNFKGNYKDWINYLYNKIPNGENAGKNIDHAINRSLFIQKISEIQAQINIEQDNLKYEIEQLNIDKTYLTQQDKQDELAELEQEIIKVNAKISNFANLNIAINQFIQEQKDKAPARIKYLHLDAIQSTEQGEIFTNKAKLSNDKFEKNNIEINLQSSVHYNNRQNVTRGRKAQDSKVKKAKYFAQSLGLFAYQRILNPFGRKSWSKYAINPGYRHWLPYMIVRQAIILPITLVENFNKSYQVNKLKYSLQKTQNSQAMQGFVSESFNNLTQEIKALEIKINNDINIDKNLEKLYNLRLEKEALIVQAAQVWRTNDNLMAQAKKLFSHSYWYGIFSLGDTHAKNRLSDFEKTTQTFIQQRKNIIIYN